MARVYAGSAVALLLLVRNVFQISIFFLTSLSRKFTHFRHALRTRNYPEAVSIVAHKVCGEQLL